MGNLFLKIGVKLAHIGRNLPIVLQIRFTIFIVKRAKESGLFRSLRQGPVDVDGTPIPWLTPASIAFIETLDISNFNMVEFGAGHSSIWFHKRVKLLTSFECDENWISKLRTKYGYFGNIQVVDKNYAGNPLDFSGCQVVLIDGLDRSKLIENMLKSISLTATLELIIVDNPDLVDFPVLEHLSSNFVRIDFRGLPNSSWGESTTSIFLPR